MEFRPLLRWAGGKIWLTNYIDNYLPESFNNYYEPFVGGASIYLFLKNKGVINKKAFLSDTNDELINAHITIRDYPEELFLLLSRFKNEKDCYYEVRAAQPATILERAARFIFLNRTSFNGIYRENLKGEYNVPFGHRTISSLFDLEHIKQISRLLHNANFTSCDFEDTLPQVKKNDLVFLDPPYTVAHENNGFIKYNKKIFAWEDQERLKSYIEKIKLKGAYFILTNAAHESIGELYNSSGKVNKLSRASLIGGKGAKRDNYNEFIFFNTK